VSTSTSLILRHNHFAVVSHHM